MTDDPETLRDALEPFASIGAAMKTEYDSCIADDDIFGDDEALGFDWLESLSAGDFRRAHAVLSTPQTEQPDDALAMAREIAASIGSQRGMLRSQLTRADEWLLRHGKDDLHPFIKIALAAITAERERSAGIVEAATTHDPEDVYAGIPDEAVDAGIDAWDKAKHDMKPENYIPGETADWDEGMIVVAIFKAVASHILKGGDDA